MSKMKRYVAALTLALAVVVIGETAAAHDPRTIELRYDMDIRLLDVAIAHDVIDASKHYIKQVDVSVNGQKQKSYYFDRQYDRQRLDESFRVEAKAIDIIEVKAYCSVLGSIEKGIQITAEGYTRDATKRIYRDYPYRYPYIIYPPRVIIHRDIRKHDDAHKKLEELRRAAEEEHIKHHKEAHPDIPVDSQSEEHLKHHSEEHQLLEKLRTLHQEPHHPHN